MGIVYKISSAHDERLVCLCFRPSTFGVMLAYYDFQENSFTKACELESTWQDMDIACLDSTILAVENLTGSFLLLDKSGKRTFSVPFEELENRHRMQDQPKNGSKLVFPVFSALTTSSRSFLAVIPNHTEYVLAQLDLNGKTQYCGRIKTGRDDFLIDLSTDGRQDDLMQFKAVLFDVKKHSYSLCEFTRAPTSQ